MKWQGVIWKVALPMGKSEVLSEVVIFWQRPERQEKTRLANGAVHSRKREHQVGDP